MAIMVILFGLLFAPMISGLGLVSRGRRHVALQDAVRLTLEQVKRDLGDAVYVFDPDEYAISSIDGAATNTTMVDYSTITFIPAATDTNGNPTTPISPATLPAGSPGAPGFQAIRYAVHLRDTTAPMSESNPFVLYREEGSVVWNGSNWVWSGTIDSENAMTPLTECNLAPTVSVCSACGSAWNGYTSKCLNPSCPDYGTSTAMHYITDAAQFVPQRITGEVLSPTASGCIYRAKWGGWLGTQNNENVLYPGGAGAVLPLKKSGELEPRITVYRLLASGLTAYLDTYSGTSLDPQLQMSWKSSDGEVRFGEWHHNGAIYSLVAPAPFYPVTVGAGPTPTPDVYSAAGGLSGKANYENDIYPIYPSIPIDPGDPAAPVGYVIDPSRHGAIRPGKVVPDSVSVRLVIYPNGGAPYYQPLEQVFTYDQDKIGRLQFCAIPSPDGRTMQIRFNRNAPPSPARYGGPAALTAFAVEITYYSRFNFNPDAALGDPDDQVYVDYSTRYVINTALSLASYVDLEPSPTNAKVMILPTDVNIHAVQGRDQVVVRNAMQ